MSRYPIRCFVAMVFFFVGLQIITINVPNLRAQSNNRLAIVICSTTSGNPPLVIEGYFIYIESGKEVKRMIDKTGWGWNFFGEYIKEVHVRKVSGDGSFQISVMENSNPVFESGSVSSLDPVIYEREKGDAVLQGESAKD